MHYYKQKRGEKNERKDHGCRIAEHGIFLRWKLRWRQRSQLSMKTRMQNCRKWHISAVETVVDIR
jgi:hypothetical protein